MAQREEVHASQVQSPAPHGYTTGSDLESEVALITSGYDLSTIE